MSLLIAAVVATLAAIVESSMLTQLLIAGVKPDLVFALTVAVAMVVGFDEGMVMAVVGGLLLDMLLPERALGSTTLALLLTAGFAVLVARTAEAPRVFFIGLVVFILTFVYQALLLVLLAVTSGVGLNWSLASIVFIGVMNTGLAVITAAVARAVVRRFGPGERVDW